MSETVSGWHLRLTINSHLTDHQKLSATGVKWRSQREILDPALHSELPKTLKKLNLLQVVASIATFLNTKY